MDELFSNLAMQTVQLVGKAAFGAAGSIALKRVSEYARRLPRLSERQPEVERLRAQFETKLRIVTPAIDLIDIIAARGHSAMASVLQLTYALRADILAFSDKLERLDGVLGGVPGAEAALPKSEKSLASLLRRTVGAPEAKSDGAAALNESIVGDMKALLSAIDDAVPLLNLALTTSGVHLGSSLPTGVSPGRLMQASALLSRATTWFDLNSDPARTKLGRGPDTLVGEPFTLRLYSLFVGSVRPKSKQDFTWKEEFVRCHAGLWRVAPVAHAHEPSLYADYCYELRIVEDRDDGRYHEDTPADDGAGAQPQWVTDMAQKLAPGTMRAGSVVRIGLRSIANLHYTSAGSLLNIEDSSSPVLVISVDHSRDASDGAVFETGLKLSTSTSTLVPEAAPAVRWYAMEIADEDLDDASESSTGSSAAESDDDDDDDVEASSANNDASDAESDAEGGAESDSGNDSGNEAYSDAGSDLEAAPASEDVAANEDAARSVLDSSDEDAAASGVADKDVDELAHGVASCNIDNDNDSSCVPPAVKNLGRPSSSGSVGDDLDLVASEEFLRPIEFLANEWRLCRLSLLEYMIRLASIETSEQLSHLEVPDEKLRLYLLNDPSDPGAAQHGIPGGQAQRGRAMHSGAEAGTPARGQGLSPLPLGIAAHRRTPSALGSPAQRGARRTPGRYQPLSFESPRSKRA